MSAANHPYRRLPGTGYRYTIPPWAMFLLFFVIGIFVLLFRGRRVQLWQGEEHLLLVEWDGSREYYKRFGYGDIQAFILRKTNEGLILNILLTVLMVPFLAGGIAVPDAVGRVVLLSFSGFFGLLLVLNMLAGSTCKCFVQTAVQLEELSSLTRRPRAQKVFARLRPLIAQAQGELPAAEVPGRLREWLSGGGTAAPRPATEELSSPGRIGPLP
jgi:hypothetical protein